MDINPYQSPATIPAAASSERLGGAPMVDGKCLVVASDTVLPQLCVKTNQPVAQRDMLLRHLYWCSPWVAILIFLSLPVLILGYFLARRHCVLTFGLDRRVRSKYRKRMLLKVVAAIGLFFAVPFSAAIDLAVAPFVVLALFLVAIVWLFIGNSPLRVVKHRKGMFWIKGFSDDFLANFQQA